MNVVNKFGIFVGVFVILFGLLGGAESLSQNSDSNCLIPMPDHYDPATPWGMLFDSNIGYSHVTKNLTPKNYSDPSDKKNHNRLLVLNLMKSRFNTFFIDDLKTMSTATSSTNAIVPQIWMVEKTSFLSLDAQDTIMVRQGEDENIINEFMKLNSSNVLRRYGDKSCQIMRIDNEHEVESQITIFGQRNSLKEDYACFYTSLMITYGLNNYHLLSRTKYLYTDDDDNFRFRWPSVGALRILYGKGISKGLSEKQLEDFLRNRNCK